MTIRREKRIFISEESQTCAREVVWHDPATPRTFSLVPKDRPAADASIAALSTELRALPASIRNALANAESSAGHISDDRLQGLAELIQNADDLCATFADFAVDATTSRLIFRHNGAGLTLHDVWALAIPWLSLKVDDPDQLGRFGIGLKTLHALSDVLEVHQGHFRVRYQANDLSVATSNVIWPGEEATDAMTTFVIPFESNAVSADMVTDWLKRWSDAGLVFLSALNTVILRGPAGEELAKLHVGRADPLRVKSASLEMTRRVAKASDAREWAIYSRSIVVQKGHTRARKAQSRCTPIAIAFSLGGPDVGHLHVGLPVRPIGLPFRLMAQFDPLTSRRDISDDPWNLSLVEPLSALWLDAILDLFERDPVAAWSAFPLDEELDSDRQTTGQLRAELQRHLMNAARTTFAKALTLRDGDQRYHLSDLSYEAPELEGVLTPNDVKTVAGTPGSVIAAVRSVDNRWRDTLRALRACGAVSPIEVEVGDALKLLDDTSRSAEFVADLVAIAVETDSTQELEKRPCLVLNDHVRITPSAAAGLGVLLPEETGRLWGILKFGQRLHPVYRERPGWKSVRDWLQDEGILLIDASDNSALRVLAKAGKDGKGRLEPLTDEQAVSLRAAFEQLPGDERLSLGAGIGQAVQFAAVTYDASGNRIQLTARPCDAYIIEREANSWRVAADKTPGLIWLHSRYAETLRAESGREGVGAQRLFRYLGAETAPRLVKHPRHFLRFTHAEPGVPRNLNDSPARRNAQMDELHATYTLGDIMSPDLDAVLSNISREKKTTDRIRRANAVLYSLNRAWERLEPYTKASAASDYYSWQKRGSVDAWWIAKAASAPWLTSASEAATEPERLRLRTAATEAFFGSNPAEYLDERLDNAAYHEVLAILGVADDPRADQLLGRLREIRDSFPDNLTEAAKCAAPLYRALAAQIRSRGAPRRTGLNVDVLRSEFRKGEGLIATNVGWRRPSDVRSGCAVFGSMHSFVPAVEGTDPLWKTLEVRPPDLTDAKGVLRKLAKWGTPTKEQLLVMLEALRILAEAPTDKLGSLAKSPVWVGDRWMSTRPVFAIENPLIADGLAGRIPIWAPGGALAQLGALVETYRLTRINACHARVTNSEYAEYDPELSRMFSNAVSNLREDLALSDPKSEASIRVPWDALARFKVCVLRDLTVTLENVLPDDVRSFSTRAWIDTDEAKFYIADHEDVADPNSGAYAVATVFASDTRRIAHDWLAAWAAAKAGYRAEAINTAASLEAEQKRALGEREAAGIAALQKLSEESERRRQKQPTSMPGGGHPATLGEGAARRQPPKTLVELSKMRLTNPAGMVIGGADTKNPATSKDSSKNVKPLRDADKNRPKANRPSGSDSAPRNYTPEEQERLGAEICRLVLGLNENEIVDIRNQHHVGADAIDYLDNFYEYKVHAGPIPDVIRLEPSQIERARKTPNFFLVVIGNLQAGAGDPEVRIITNPLDQLTLQPTTSVQFAGVLAARALTYRFTTQGGNQDEEVQ